MKKPLKTAKRKPRSATLAKRVTDLEKRLTEAERVLGIVAADLLRELYPKDVLDPGFKEP